MAYNDDPLDQLDPDPANAGWDPILRGIRTNPPDTRRFSFMKIVELADMERWLYIQRLNKEAQAARARELAATNEPTAALEHYRWELIHEQMNALFDEIAFSPPEDLMKRPNISKAQYETIPRV